MGLPAARAKYKRCGTPKVLDPDAGIPMTPDQLESYAIRCAKGNNNGEWSTLNEDQKNFWRAFVADLAKDIVNEFANALIMDMTSEKQK